VEGLRARNRRALMRAVQREALRRFRAVGFDSVTIEQLAEAVGSSPSTVYRHFGTKEAIVLWDEHEDAIGDELMERLQASPPLAALRDTFVHSLGARYERDREFELERVRYVYETEQLRAAGLLDDVRGYDEIVAALRESAAVTGGVSPELVTGASMIALDVALQRWVSGDGTLPDLIADAFDQLLRLGELG
jgi:AcrR family transcriptional regulator